MQRSQQLYGRFRKNLKDKLVYHNSYERARLVRMKKMESDLDRLCLLELRCIDLNCSNNVNVLRTEEHLFRKLKKARIDRWMEERVGQHYRKAVDGAGSGDADRDADGSALSTPSSPQPHQAQRPAPHRVHLYSQPHETPEPHPAGASQQRQLQPEIRDQKRTPVLPEHFRKQPGDVENDRAAGVTEVAAAAAAGTGHNDSSRQLERATGTDGGGLTPNTLRQAAAARGVQTSKTPPSLPQAVLDVSANRSDRLPPLLSPRRRREQSGRDGGGGGESRRTPLHLHRPQLHRSVVYSKYWGRLVYSSEDRGALFQDVRRQRLRMLDAERAELTHVVVAFARKIAGDGGDAPLAPHA